MILRPLNLPWCKNGILAPWVIFFFKNPKVGFASKKVTKMPQRTKTKRSSFFMNFKSFLLHIFSFLSNLQMLPDIYINIYFCLFFSLNFFCICNIYKVSNDLEGHFCHPYLLQEVTLPSIFVWSCAFVCKYFSLLTIFTVQCTIYKVQYKVLST